MKESDSCGYIYRSENLLWPNGNFLSPHVRGSVRIIWLND